MVTYFNEGEGTLPHKNPHHVKDGVAVTTLRDQPTQNVASCPISLGLHVLV